MCTLFHRYLIDTKWFKQWKKYVGFDNWDTSYVGDQSANPGPIDNSPLLKGNVINESWSLHIKMLCKGFLLTNEVSCVVEHCSVLSF